MRLQSNNALLKIHIIFKLVVRKYKRGCLHFLKKTCSLGLDLDGEFVIKH